MSFDRRGVILGSIAAAAAPRVMAQTRSPQSAQSRHMTFPDPTETIDLWPAPPARSATTLLVETARERSTDSAYNDRYVSGISRPRMAVFRPAKPDGSAVLITPGGGYNWVVIDKEGYEMARWLAARGTTVFVLFYRLPHEGWASGPDTPLADAQRAMRLIRHRASSLRIDPSRVVVMGFSAGGHVCASLLTRFDASVYRPLDAADRESARPDAAAPIYPVISMTLPIAHAGSRTNLLGAQISPELERRYDPSKNVPPNAPPTFLLHAEDDRSVVVENSLMMRSALLARNVPVETHLFADGGHGFGLRLSHGKSVDGWQALFHAWGRKKGMFA